MKKLLALLLALVMVLSLAACGDSGQAPSGGGGSSGGSNNAQSGGDGELVDDGKLTIWTWDKTFNIAAMNVAKEMYQKDHPDVEITIEEVLSEDIESRVIASNGDTSTLPDIILVQDNSIEKFVTNYPEVYHDITGKFDLSGFSAAKVAYSTVDGKNYGIPFDAGTVVAAWRTDYLDDAGYTVDDLNDIDWNRFLEIGRDVKSKTGMPMLSGQAGAVDTVMIMLQSCGSSMFNEDGSANLANNEELKTVIDIYNTMVKEGIFIEVNSWDEYIGTLSNGSVVGTINGCWILSTIMSLQDQTGKWDITNMPSLPGVSGATNYSNNGGSTWAIINGKDIDLALDFMKIYTNVDFYNEILPTTSAVACYSPAKEASNYTAPSDFFNGTPIFATILEYGDQVPSNNTGAFYYDARAALGTAVTNVLNGADIDAELQTAEETVNFTMGI